MQPDACTGSHSSPERLAYWYFRLNGFMTIENFLVHHETQRNPRTDVDILAARFAYRQENSDRPMVDDPRVTACETFANIIIAEIKKGKCRLNGPWTDPGHRNMERVLSSIGCVRQDEIALAAQSLYGAGKWSNHIATVRLFAVGERTNDYLVVGPEQQIVWTSVIKFCVGRLYEYRLQKASQGQWAQDGRRLSQLARRNNIESIRSYFGLEPQTAPA
jgi:hypothetical protein